MIKSCRRWFIKKLYAMELLLQEYLNRFIIEINEWEEDDE